MTFRAWSFADALVDEGIGKWDVVACVGWLPYKPPCHARVFGSSRVQCCHWPTGAGARPVHLLSLQWGRAARSFVEVLTLRGSGSGDSEFAWLPIPWWSGSSEVCFPVGLCRRLDSLVMGFYLRGPLWAVSVAWLSGPSIGPRHRIMSASMVFFLG